MIMVKHHARNAAMTLIALAAFGALATSGGCYERVINARGPGADQVQVAEPYQDAGSGWENWLMGPPPDPTKRNGSRLNR
jgi:hypothetical protein